MKILPFITRTEIDLMTSIAIYDAIAKGRAFYWIKSRKPHGLTLMRDWQPRLFQ